MPFSEVRPGGLIAKIENLPKTKIEKKKVIVERKIKISECFGKTLLWKRIGNIKTKLNDALAKITRRTYKIDYEIVYLVFIQNKEIVFLLFAGEGKISTKM